MYTCTPRWQQGPPPPQCLRIALPGRPRMAQPVHVPAVSLRELTGTTALKAWGQCCRLPSRGFTGAQSRYHGLQIVEKSLGLPKSRLLRVTQTSESLGIAPVRWVNPGGRLWKKSRSERFCPQNPHIPMFVTAPVLESPPVVVKQVQPAPVVEYVTPASAVTYAHASLVVKYVTPAPIVA